MPSTSPVIRGNSLYTIVDGPSWTEAEARAVKLGGHLIAPSTQAEDIWIREYISDFEPVDYFWWRELRSMNKQAMGMADRRK